MEHSEDLPKYRTRSILRQRQKTNICGGPLVDGATPPTVCWLDSVSHLVAVHLAFKSTGEPSHDTQPRLFNNEHFLLGKKVGMDHAVEKQTDGTVGTVGTVHIRQSAFPPSDVCFRNGPAV